MPVHRHVLLQPDGRARRPRVHDAERVQNLVWWHGYQPASEAPCEAARSRRANARDAIRRRTLLRMRVPGVGLLTHLRATLHLTCVRGRTTRDASGAK